jgi:hypothetical protein
MEINATEVNTDVRMKKPMENNTGDDTNTNKQQTEKKTSVKGRKSKDITATPTRASTMEKHEGRGR